MRSILILTFLFPSNPVIYNLGTYDSLNNCLRAGEKIVSDIKREDKYTFQVIISCLKK